MWRLRNFVFAGLGLVLLGAGYVAYIAKIGGEFRAIEPHFAGSCRVVGGVVGAEDIVIAADGTHAFISSDDRRATLDGTPRPGAIFALRLNGQDIALQNLTPNATAAFHPHGLDLYEGKDGRRVLFVVNHNGKPGTREVEHSVEIFDIAEGQLRHRASIKDPRLVSPNDVVAVGPEAFYVTNDHGRKAGLMRKVEEYLMLPWANVLYFDGEGFNVVAGKLRYANGINVSPNGQRIYVAATTGRRVHVYRRDVETGALSHESSVFTDTGVDNIDVDAEGNLWIAAHPKLLTFARHAGDPAKRRAPSQVLKLSHQADDSFILEEIFLGEGDVVSGAAVAARHGERLLIGPVFDPRFLDCRLG